MTDQEVFTTVATHLLTQMEVARPKGDSIGCLYHYRTPEKVLKCAVGVLIPEAHYHERLEGLGCWRPEVRDAAGLTQPQVDDRAPQCGLAVVLQRIHDTNPVERWKLALTELAHERGLVMPLL